ncbi:alpha/beta hydrolase [Kribbella sp. NPDC023972]|uniref:alpha/beta fold hydrolase n=1 Tax=Kribbella sp. NPDC023972 TaxID=3154795 RepID=UPI00340C73CB
MIYGVDTVASVLHVERAGDGPTVVLVPGGGGDAAIYQQLVPLLARRFSVITYDRRGNSRSRWKNGRQDVGLDGQAADVVAILDHAGLDQAFVFGSSAGALITLTLLTSYADRLAGAVVHEPPVIRVLPDAAERQVLFDDVARIAAAEGSLPAMLKFAATTMEKPPRLFESRVGRTVGATGVRLANLVVPKGNDMRRLFGNAELLIGAEMPLFVRYQPDLAALRGTGVRWAFGVGEASEGRYYSRPARQLGADLGVPCLEFPGGHLGYQQHAEEFARRLEAFIDG